MNRRKFEVDMQKRQYERHLHNLELIEAQKKTTKKRIEKSKLFIDRLIEKSHKLHAQSNEHKFRILSLDNKLKNEDMSKKYSRIKSVVKTEMINQLPFIPTRQKNTQRQFYLDKENMCLFNRLMCAKPSIQFRQFRQQKNIKSNGNTPPLLQNKIYNKNSKDLHKKQKSGIYSNDFSDILNSSILGQVQKKKITMKLHKKSNQECLIIKFNKEEMKKAFKNFQRSYLLQIQSSLNAINEKNKQRLRTQIMDLQNILNQQYHIFRHKDEQVLIKFYQVYSQKQIYKGHIEIPINFPQNKTIYILNFCLGSKSIFEIGIKINCHKVMKKQKYTKVIIHKNEQHKKQ